MLILPIAFAINIPRNGLVAGLKEMVSTEYRSLTRPEGTPIGSSDSEVYTKLYLYS